MATDSKPAADKMPATDLPAPGGSTNGAPGPAKEPSRWGRMLRRLTATEAELDAEELQSNAVQCGSMPASVCRRGQVVSVTGRLRTVVYTPRINLPTLEAELYDGSDLVTLVWLGRRHIAGIEPGRALTAKGRIAVRDDRKVIYNPYYELEAPR